MGKTLATSNEYLQKLESRLVPFRKALRREDQLIVDELLANAKKHLSAVSESGTPLPFEMMLFTMLIEQQKQIEALKRITSPAPVLKIEQIPSWMQKIDKPE